MFKKKKGCIYGLIFLSFANACKKQKEESSPVSSSGGVEIKQVSVSLSIPDPSTSITDSDAQVGQVKVSGTQDAGLDGFAPPAFDIREATFDSVLNEDGSGKFSFALECTSPVTGSKPELLCENIELAKIRYKLVKDDFGGIPTFDQLQNMFQTGTSEVAPLYRFAASETGFIRGGFETISLDGPASMQNSRDMLFILESERKSYRIFNVLAPEIKTQAQAAMHSNTTLAAVNGSWKSNSFVGGETLYDAFFVNDKIGWAIGSLSKIYKSADGGNSWNEQNSGSSPTDNLDTLHFIDQNTGWAMASVSPHFLLKTEDGGQKWKRISLPEPFCEEVLALKWHDANNGWIFADSNILLKTNNGGITWKGQTLPPLPLGISKEGVFKFRAADFKDASTAWIAGNIVSPNVADLRAVVARTTDGGKSWAFITKTSAINGDLNILYFLNDTTGWIGGNEQSALYKTTDSGVTWTKEIIDQGNQVEINEVKFATANEGWVFGTAKDSGMSIIYATKDGGISWKAQLKTSTLGKLRVRDVNHLWTSSFPSTLWKYSE